MRLRFTIRDLLWLTLVVALVLGWSFDMIRHEEMVRENAALHENQTWLLKENDDLRKQSGRLTTRLTILGHEVEVLESSHTQDH